MTSAIVTSADKNYLPGVIALYNSYVKNARWYAAFYLLAHGDPKDFKNLPAGIQVIYNKETVKSPTSSVWPEEIPAMYSRLLIPQLFTQYDRVLWLDADIIILKEIESLMNIDMQGYPCAACLPGGPYNPSKYNLMAEQFEENVPQEFEGVKAIQAGVILFDIKAWNKTNLTERITKLLLREKSFKFVVQGLLGYVLKGNFLTLDYSWNWYINWTKLDSDWDENVHILHYIGQKGQNPWSHSMIEDNIWRKYAGKDFKWVNTSILPDLKDKQVIVVGNAEALSKKNKSKFIDSHEIVIRFNYGTNPHRPQNLGKKIDIAIFDCIFKNYNFLDLHCAKVAVSRDFTRIDSYTNRCFKNERVRYGDHPRKFYGVQDKKFIWLPIWNDVETQNRIQHPVPSTGALMLNYLTHCNCASVDVIGFDWKETPTYYHSEEQALEGSPHDFDNEKVHMLKLIEEQEWNLI